MSCIPPQPPAVIPTQTVTAVQRGWQARIQQIHDLLVNAVVGEDPPDDGIAEPGMVLTIRYDDTGDTETFLLSVRGAEYGDIEVYSNQSPLGAAIAGARPGERRSYTLPSGATLTVTLLRRRALRHVHGRLEVTAHVNNVRTPRITTSTTNYEVYYHAWREQALKTRARISLVAGSADGGSDAAGIAALLRW